MRWQAPRSEFVASRNPLDFRNLWYKLDEGMLAVLGYGPTAVYDWMRSTPAGRAEAADRAAPRTFGARRMVWITTAHKGDECVTEYWAPADVIYKFATEVAGVVPEALIDEAYYSPILLYRVVFAAMRLGMSMRDLYDKGWGYTNAESNMVKHFNGPACFRKILVSSASVSRLVFRNPGSKLRENFVSFHKLHTLCRAVGLELGDIVVNSRMKKVDGAQVSIYKLLSALDVEDVAALFGVAAALAGSHGAVGKDVEAVKREVLEVLNWWDTTRRKE